MTSIVKAEESDASVLRGICIRSFAEDKALYGAMPPGMDKLSWHQYNIKTGLYYKIVEDNNIIGGIKLFNLGDGHMSLGTIYIDPAYQDRHIGTAAIGLIEREYPYIKKWSLDTPYKSYRNHHFYQKLGYIKVGEERPESDNEFTLYIYEKTI